VQGHAKSWNLPGSDANGGRNDADADADRDSIYNNNNNDRLTAFDPGQPG